MRTEVIIDYTNHRGERAERLVQPIKIEFNTSEFHDGEQWFLLAHARDREGRIRMFAMNNIHSWRPA
jgi:predicted DNA-binding transcriptional regulator YafY